MTDGLSVLPVELSVPAELVDTGDRVPRSSCCLP